MRSQAFVVINQTCWVIDELFCGVDETVYDFHVSYGWDLPKSLSEYDSVSYWMPGEYGAEVQRVGFAPNLCSPGPLWLPAQDRRYTGRTTTVATVSEVLSNPPKTPVFIKPADVKIEHAQAQVMTPQEVRANLAQWHPETFIHYTDRICDFSEEYRFFVVDDDLLTGSIYLSNGVTVYDGAEGSRYPEAFHFAAKFLEDSLGEHPESFTLDIGFDTIGSEWLVIEGNPAWSSGFYDSNIEHVITAVDRACNPNNPETYRWEPDPYLRDKVSMKRPIRLM